MKVLQFIETKYILISMLILVVILSNSCGFNNCGCEEYQSAMAEITISVKSLDENDIEVRCVGRYCCSRKINDSCWTVIRKDYAELICSYDKIENPNEHYSKKTDSLYNLGFGRLSFDILNIKNIEDITKVDLQIDSIINLPNTRISAIYFDEFPNYLSFELVDDNGSLKENFINYKLKKGQKLFKNHN